MEFIRNLSNFILHIDSELEALIDKTGNLVYVILFLIIFAETGIVIFPFLPGDSLIFAAGALAASDLLNPLATFLILLIAGIIGDSINYNIGHKLGPNAYKMQNKLINPANISRAEKFYEKHGGKAIILARFVPIIRTFAPFAAGISKMDYRKFIIFNVTGAVLWVSIFFGLGFFFGNIPFVEENFHYVVVGILLVSVIPIVIEFLKSRAEKKELEV